MTAPSTYSTITPSIVIVRLLWRCFFAVFAVVAGTVVLAAVPQAREALKVFAADAIIRPMHAAFFICAVLYGNDHMAMLEQKSRRAMSYFQDRRVRYAA